MSLYDSKRKKLFNALRYKQKPTYKATIQDLMPFTCRPERIPMEKKKLVYELQAEYIKRHNILIGNREIYAKIIESMSTELDGRVIGPQDLTKMLLKCKIEETHSQNTRPE